MLNEYISVRMGKCCDVVRTDCFIVSKLRARFMLVYWESSREWCYSKRIQITLQCLCFPIADDRRKRCTSFPTNSQIKLMPTSMSSSRPTRRPTRPTVTLAIRSNSPTTCDPATVQRACRSRATNMAAIRFTIKDSSNNNSNLSFSHNGPLFSPMIFTMAARRHSTHLDRRRPPISTPRTTITLPIQISSRFTRDRHKQSVHKSPIDRHRPTTVNISQLAVIDHLTDRSTLVRTPTPNDRNTPATTTHTRARRRAMALSR